MVAGTGDSKEFIVCTSLTPTNVVNVCEACKETLTKVLDGGQNGQLLDEMV